MFALLMVLSLALQNPESKTQAPANGGTSGKAGADVANATPEQAIRTFMLAMVAHDAATLRAVTLPADDLDVLMPGQPLTAEELKEVKAQIAGLKVLVFKAGDEIAFANGQKMKVKPEDVTPDRAVVMPDGTSFPAFCRKVEGGWKVDARPIIASLKPAKAAPPKAVDPASIKEKISMTLGQKIDVQFDQKGDVLSNAKVVEKAGNKSPTVHIEFSKTGEDLFLSTQNPFPTDLTFRAIYRLKGSKTYWETSIWPVKANIAGIEMWRDPIEELVLFDFKLKPGDQ